MITRDSRTHLCRHYRANATVAIQRVAAGLSTPSPTVVLEGRVGGVFANELPGIIPLPPSLTHRQAHKGDRVPRRAVAR